MEARYTVKNSSGTSGVQVQKYQVTFERVPTADISLKDAKGRALNLGFEPDITEYETDTVSSKVIGRNETYGTDGYSVTVKNGDTVSEDGNCNLSKGINSVTVTVAHTNGKSRTYHFKVNLVEKVPVTLKTPDGVKAVIVDAKDKEIEPEEDGTYALIPGASYSYIASKDDTYFARKTFQVKAAADGTDGDRRRTGRKRRLAGSQCTMLLWAADGKYLHRSRNLNLVGICTSTRYRMQTVPFMYRRIRKMIIR